MKIEKNDALPKTKFSYIWDYLEMSGVSLLFMVRPEPGNFTDDYTQKQDSGTSRVSETK